MASPEQNSDNTIPSQTSKPTLSLRTPPSPAFSAAYPSPASPFSLPTPSTACSSPARPSSPPPTPTDWHWRCHRCGHAYRLSCTARCLDCGHRFCGTRAPGRPSSRRRPGTCAVFFDLDGWEAWGLWRRAADFPGRQDYDARAALFDDGVHDCVRHCDFPGQCRQMAAMRRRARQREAEDFAVVTRAELAALSAAARMMGADAVSPIDSAEQRDLSWLSSSSEGDGAGDGVVVEYFEDVVDGDLGVRIVEAAAGGRAMMCAPVSPESPDVGMTDVFWGASCGMDEEEWQEELSPRQDLGHAETRSTRVVDASGEWADEMEGRDLAELAATDGFW